MKVPLGIQDAWLALKQTAFEVIASTSDAFNSAVIGMQETANKIPFLSGKFGTGGSETLSNITQGARGEVSQIEQERQGIQGQISGIDNATDSAIDKMAFPTNEEGTAFDTKDNPTETGLEVLAEAEQKKIDRLPEIRADAKAKELEEEKKFREALNSTVTGYLLGNVKTEKATKEEVLQVHARFKNDMLALANSSNKQLAAIGKAYAISQATINTYEAANLAMATLPPPFGQIAAAAAIASGLANVRAIISTNPQSSAIAGTTSGLALGSIPPQDSGANNSTIAENQESAYYKNKLQIEFVGDAARVLQAVNKEGATAGFI